MKKIAMLGLVLLTSLMGCKETQKEETTITEQTAVEHKEKSHGDQNNWMSQIQLDNGSKWKANIETTEGLQAMSSRIAEDESNSIKNYKQLASDLNDLKNKIIKECTMEGESHDNLHVFLVPLADKIEALGEVNSVHEGAVITRDIREHLEVYYNYFN
ncbi:MAG: hypothetical protein JJE07_11110 [Flavobacteriaceae bacterium]|nr:hypothetical protein [Flavobacteriaceae bacterium]